MKKIKLLLVVCFSILLYFMIPNFAYETYANTESHTGKAERLPDKMIEFTNNSYYSDYKIIPMESKGGFYIYSLYTPISYGSASVYPEGKIRFVNLETMEEREVVSFSHVTNMYYADDIIYILRYDRETGSSQKIYSIESYDLKSEKSIKTIDLSAYSENNMLTAVGVDNQGRYYVSSAYLGEYIIYLLDDQGEELGRTNTKNSIYRFCAFDETNGNYYFEAYLNWIYWGYDHDTRQICCGNVSDDNTIVADDRYVEILFQEYYYDHLDCTRMYGGKYLGITSSLNGRLIVLDSNKFDINGTSLTTRFVVSRKEIEDNKRESIGPRLVYLDKSDTFVFYVSKNEIVEMDADNNFVSSYITDYKVFDIEQYGDKLLVFETDDTNYYLEILDWSDPTEMFLNQTSATMKVEETLKLVASADTCYDIDYVWSSSDYSIASVTESGEVYAYKPGTVTITASCDRGLSVSCEINVIAKENTVLTQDSTITSGIESSNISKNDYSTWSSVTDSHLFDSGNGEYERVEAIGDKINVEKYNSDFSEVLSSKEIEIELTKYGGVFYGNDYNYIVYGQNNLDEDDEMVVVQVVKYSKAWEKVDSCDISGINTIYPFEAGNLRMEEEGGKLYIHTCHEMYRDEEGLIHQANMTFVINELDMSLEQSQYEVSNLSSGYVSHSFNQFICIDDGFIYRVDHSEASPMNFSGMLLSANGITLTKASIGGGLTSVRAVVPYESKTHRGNYTGFSIGGMATSENNVLIAFAADGSVSYKRDVFVNITPKSLNKGITIKLTDYDNNDNLYGYTPHLTKINDNTFLVMWEEYDASTRKKVLCKILIDEQGNHITEIIKSEDRLSDCEPILCSDGMVRWYVTDNSSPVVYTVNPYMLNPNAFTGLKEENGVWKYFEDGEFKKENRIIENDGSWWSVRDGIVDFSYTGLWYDPIVGWWYIENGSVNFNYSGIIYNDGSFWCVNGGYVDFSYTGLWYDPVVGWWYIENGSVNFNYSGIILNDGSYWCVNGGYVDFSYTGLWYDPVVGWWYIENGSVNFNYSGIVYNDGSFWCVNGGYVDFNYTGYWYDEQYGWWYMENGKVKFD